MTGFAVIDVETTGLGPSDRVVELAIIHLDESGRTEGEWETLVRTDVGLAIDDLHGIRDADLRRAPSFTAIAADVVRLLAGRVVVAHNAPLEARFLRAELERAGWFSPLDPIDALCTIQLAGVLLPGSGRSLGDALAAFDLEAPDRHEALADARAIAELVRGYLAIGAWHPIWEQRAAHARTLVWPRFPASSGTTWQPRSRVRHSLPSRLEAALSLLPPIDPSTAEETRYLAMVDAAVADGVLSLAEADALRDLAAELDIADRERERLHATYFDELVAIVWIDGDLDEPERERLARVGAMLDIPEAAITAATGGSVPPLSHPDRANPFARAPIQLEPGDRVALSGEFSTPRGLVEARLVEAGYAPFGAVTRGVALLVTGEGADASGKVRKARDYGIPVVDESWLLDRLGL